MIKREFGENPKQSEPLLYLLTKKLCRRIYSKRRPLFRVNEKAVFAKEA